MKEQVKAQWELVYSGIVNAVDTTLNPKRKADGYLDIEKTGNLFEQVLGQAKMLKDFDESIYCDYSKLSDDDKRELSELKYKVKKELDRLDVKIGVMEGLINEAYHIWKLSNSK